MEENGISAIDGEWGSELEPKAETGDTKEVDAVPNVSLDEAADDTVSISVEVACEILEDRDVLRGSLEESALSPTLLFLE